MTTSPVNQIARQAPSRVPALLALATLAACSFTPAYTRPAAPVPAAYDRAAPAPAAAPLAPDLPYAATFGDPRLVALITRALAANRDLAAAAARVDAARGTFRVARADLFPTLGANAGADQARTASRFGSFETPFYQLGLAITSFELDFWGRVRAARTAARERYLQSDEARRAFALSLVADVTDAYVTERETTERIALATRALTSRREALRIARLRLDAGVTSALDYRQTEVLLRQAQVELTTLENRRAAARNLLLALTGGPDPTPLPAPRPLFAPDAVADVAPGLPSTLLEARPDVRAAEAAIRAANADVGAARAAFLPRIALTTAAGFASAGLSNIFTSGFNYDVGGAATVPLLDFGRNRGNLAVARATRDQAVAQYQSTIQTAFREVADALAARRWLAEGLAAETLTQAAQRDRARLATLRYRNGVANYLEVLDAERDLFAAEQAVVATRARQITNGARLYVALGGGALRAPGQPALAPARRP